MVCSIPLSPSLIVRSRFANESRWDCDQLEYGEVADNHTMFHLRMLQECKIGGPIKGMHRGKDHWMIQQRNGQVAKLDLNTLQVTPISFAHAGAILSAATAPVVGPSGLDGLVGEFMPNTYSALMTIVCSPPLAVCVVSAGNDGTVRSWNVVSGQPVGCRAFNKAARVVAW